MDLQHLPNALPNEKVIMFMRRNWTTPFGIFIFMFFSLAIPLVGFVIFYDQINNWLTTPFIGHVLILVITAYILAIWLFTFLEFTDYYLDVWIVTTERIINIEQKGLFTRVASELHLSMVEDTTSEVKGIIHTFLNYGNVFIQTAGERTRFIFKDVPNPEMVKERVVKLTEDYKARSKKE
jgi:hypothetical protein